MTQVALIIDDNRQNLEALALLLKREGMKPVTVDLPRNIPQVVETLEQIAIVFLDLEFPNGDGLQIIHELQQYPHLRHVPIVAYTVHISEQNEARAAGFHSFLGKPLSVDRFPDQLRRILSGEHVWEAI